MKNVIIYPKESGNTYGICRYIEMELNIAAERVPPGSDIDISGADNIIICSGVYGGHVHKNILQWLESQQSFQSRKFYLMLTWFGRGNSNYAAYKEVKEKVMLKNGKMSEDIFCCYGKGFGIIRQLHPDENDYKNALNWVKQII